VIWGLDLKDMQWGKFKGSYMFNRDYHLRRSKMVVYQIAMIACVISESLGTAMLSDYVSQQKYIHNLGVGAAVYNNNYVGIASYNIFVGVAIATIFGAAFFFDLFWPERYESPGVKLAWKISAVFVCVAALGDALAYTYIVATKSSYIFGVSPQEAAEIYAKQGNKPIAGPYKHNARAVASIVFLWVGWVATIASTCILFASIKHNDQYGAKTAHLRAQEEAEAKEPTSQMREAPLNSSMNNSQTSTAVTDNTPYNATTHHGLQTSAV